MIVQNRAGQLVAMGPRAAAPSSPLTVSGYLPTAGQPLSYLAFYRSQPNIRTCVEFLARNLAQLGIHVFRRVADDDRVRLTDHPLVTTLEAPNEARTRYRLIEELMIDMGVYFNAYWLKVREELPDRLGLVRLPPYEVTVQGGVLPTAYTWAPVSGQPWTLDPADVVHFSGYGSYEAPCMGISPLETLAAILAEEREATAYRASYWRNGARINGVLTREKGTIAGNWNNDQTAEYARQFGAMYTGRGALKGGGTPILPVGMDFKTNTFNARDSEYVSGGKLRREICASLYQIPLPMVGILDHATFSNVKEQHKQTYQDTIGPWCKMIELEIKRQILSEFADSEDVYVEFNLAEKLRGDFEEQASAFQTLIGRPVMTVNEGRARLNLPRSNDPADDKVARPLNMTTGDETIDDTGEDVPGAAMSIVRAHWDRQRIRLARVPTGDRARAFDLARWNRELAADLVPVFTALGLDAHAAGRRALATAARINACTRAQLAAGHPVFAEGA